MDTRPLLILDPYFRRMEEIFDSRDVVRLKSLMEVIWGRDEPMPPDEFEEAKPKAFAIVASDWHYGSVKRYLRNVGRLVVDDPEAMVAGLPPYAMQRVKPEWVYRLE